MRVMRAGGWAAALGAVLMLAGCASRTERATEPVLARFYAESPAANSPVVTLPQSGVRIAIAPRPVFSEYDIAHVETAQLELGQCLLFQLKPAASRDLYRLSVAHQGQRLVLMLNGAALGARRLDAPVSDGVIAIFVEQPETALAGLAAGVQEACAEIARATRK